MVSTQVKKVIQQKEAFMLLREDVKQLLAENWEEKVGNDGENREKPQAIFLGMSFKQGKLLINS